MRRVMVRYRVKPEHVAENERLVRDVYAELGELDPDGFRYGTFTLDDGLTFVHLATHEDGANPLGEVAAFRRFPSNIGERCDEPPVVAALREVGSYRLAGVPS